MRWLRWPSRMRSDEMCASRGRTAGGRSQTGVDWEFSLVWFGFGFGMQILSSGEGRDFSMTRKRLQQCRAVLCCAVQCRQGPLHLSRRGQRDQKRARERSRKKKEAKGPQSNNRRSPQQQRRRGNDAGRLGCVFNLDWSSRSSAAGAVSLMS
ncbi:hypothetical protein B0H63DRAFT_166615 [Podospora didyma]|uniref:Uncharacterized protein n=1 Tax=Podospora didyma TaxID=330526 RepID=A0AAE0NUH7_9PEZI|nr:hypothetical protein B0H63DRAFT_166615 [Podospora didyma]